MSLAGINEQCFSFLGFVSRLQFFYLSVSLLLTAQRENADISRTLDRRECKEFGAFRLLASDFSLMPSISFTTTCIITTL